MGRGAAPRDRFCTFADNEAGLDTGNVYRGGGIYFSDCGPRVTSSILWGNTDGGTSVEEAQVYEGEGGHAEVDPPVYRYNCIAEFSQSGGDNVGNINADPLFADPAGVTGTPADDFRVKAFSPVIDAGDDTDISPESSDLIGALRNFDDPLTPDTGPGAPPVVDMGAYEYFVDCNLNEIHDACDLDCNATVLVCPPDCGQNAGEDCNGNWQIDDCEIDEFPSLDGDNNEILDECQPKIDHEETDDPFSVRSFSGYIDPRQESSDGVDSDLGITQVSFLFTEPVVSLATGNPVTVADFSVTTTGGTAPGVSSVDHSGNPTIVVTLDAIIPLQQWTTVIADVKSEATGYPIVDLGQLGDDDEPDRVDIGFLPADVDQSGEVGPFDILELRQYANLVITPPEGVLGDYIDINRNGVAGTDDPFDLLALRQLINGVSPPATKVWNGEALPTRP